MRAPSDGFEPVIDRYPLPDTTDGICSLIRSVLESDKGAGAEVTRIEIDASNPLVRVTRMVPGSEMGLRENEETWDTALSKVPMYEYYSAGADPSQVIVDMTMLVQRHDLHCVGWAAGKESPELIGEWLELLARDMPVIDVPGLIGLPLRLLDTLPAETLVLCGSRHRDPDPSEIELAVKTTIELRTRNGRRDLSRSEVDGRSRAGTEGPATTTGGVAPGVGGFRQIAWKGRSHS